MDWKTSNSFFQRVGIQFFAEDEGGGDAFMEAFEDIDAGEDQPATDDPKPQDTPEAEPQTTEQVDKPEKPAEEQPGTGEDQQQPDAKPAPTERMVPLVYNGQRTALPESAVMALSRALGGSDVVSLLQKGMNYEARGQREISILDRYAQAGGYDNRAAYMDAMEQQLSQHRIDTEVKRLQEQYPEIPEEALRPLAERTVNDRIAQEKSQADQQARQASMEEFQRKGREMTRPWMEFLRAYPNVDPKSLDKEFFELVNTGLHPQAAYERQQGEKARAEAEKLKEQIKAAEKNSRNRQQTVGSMASDGDNADSFLSGFGMI